MKRWAICYVSSENDRMEENHIEILFSQTQRNNMANDISGILLYSQGNFFQVIEGNAITIKELFKKIENDDRHRNLFRVFNREIKQDQYDDYCCDFLTKYNQSEELNENYYLQFLKNLDHSSQTAVQNILKAFVD
ncbi:BLUF domain-containing protein [Zunongwangia atlantica]|uniref:BLUF-domain-containing protein n=1 Tax=Zunongwangia atlantica 22II14-10F7 TaxID=1185767 RepID=A0A1Y1T5A3_9FLAO|nr:BLUF domain-containing protein [Zunongwangia atlantica]ORL46231.1 BLUF-domain-containing protein [Zunongwangia atlantica 22II14-10F7]